VSARGAQHLVTVEQTVTFGKAKAFVDPDAVEPEPDVDDDDDEEVPPPAAQQ